MKHVWEDHNQDDFMIVDTDHSNHDQHFYANEVIFSEN